MKYENIRRGIFISRPNRFIAHIEIAGKTEICHVKNTGRCKELLIPGATVMVQEFSSGKRKTKYDLIAVYKGNLLINMDSQVPNKVFAEWAEKSGLFGNITRIRPECKYKNSRFDFLIEAESGKAFVEVKGVTLEDEGVAMFPDAPTERGVKHVTELCGSIDEGYGACIVFIIQMKGPKYFTPNYETHAEFGRALKAAKGKGVKLFALDCVVTEDSISADSLVEIKL